MYIYASHEEADGFQGDVFLCVWLRGLELLSASPESQPVLASAPGRHTFSLLDILIAALVFYDSQYHSRAEPVGFKADFQTPYFPLVKILLESR